MAFDTPQSLDIERISRLQTYGQRLAKSVWKPVFNDLSLIVDQGLIQWIMDPLRALTECKHPRHVLHDRNYN